MANPMEMATPSFWDASRNFDKIAETLGAPVRKLTDQFQLIGEVDTKKISTVAQEVWGEDESTNGVRADIANTLQSLNEAKNYLSHGWQGEAFINFNSATDKAIRALEDVADPLAQLSESLKEMAAKFDESVGDLMTTVAGVGGILSAIGGVVIALMAAPEPTLITKALGIIVAVIGALVAAVAYVGAQFKAIEQRKKAAQAVIDECKTTMSSIKR
ncbi:WXG100 family type VII secretion target [Saccharopolyspora sp. NPDC049426]|uniref:WXG100 family type VII secretion target n=1 Tax=Saccharopolyspora sp. NPDC049426 TaxID=3155652 RepID=UPI00341A0CA9